MRKQQPPQLPVVLMSDLSPTTYYVYAALRELGADRAPVRTSARHMAHCLSMSSVTTHHALGRLRALGLADMYRHGPQTYYWLTGVPVVLVLADKGAQK